MKARRDRGVAGLDVLLGIIVMLFVIGFLVMVFALMGGELTDETVDENVVHTITNETVGPVNETGINVSAITIKGYDTLTVTRCINTSTDVTINSGNYSVSDTGRSIRYIAAGLGGGHNNTLWNCSFTYQSTDNNTASDVIYTTSDQLSEVTDWFGIIIVIGAMVVLILLTVIIISAIKGSGMMAMSRGKGPKMTA